MKILVPVKRVVDYHVKINVKSDGTGVNTQNVKMSMNPFDENAMEEAVRLKENNIADEVVAVSIGTSASQEILRKALALGADRAILLETNQELEPLAVAKILAKIVEEESPNLVLFGKQAIDNDCNQTGQMLAGFLDWPQATFASKIKIADGKATVTREVDAGLETITVTLPAVITVDLRINEPRYPSMPNIMKSKQKTLDVKSLDGLGIDVSSRVSVLKTEPPLSRSKGKIISNINDLIDNLHVNSKVL